ncbi:MAG: hypothetical protein A2201_08765 [Alicyclobacillus sp. RIFOXYA1_FULL_53_8]|nr:MAG: hypothetical protein A2201_08765 [Alicyclobacillus sp. RIFOXYA1_FULL_53_8]
MTNEFDWKTWFFKVWEDNRHLTNNVAPALASADALDKTPVEGMRSFRQLLLEIWGIERAYAQGLGHDDWQGQAPPETLHTASVDELFAFGREVREQTRQVWSTIPFESLTQVRPDPFWGGPEGTVMGWLTYALENEIHHRGQGYVYLRLLGHEPPAFYVRTES